MKKIIILFSVLAIAFSSCKKEAISKCAGAPCLFGHCDEVTGGCICDAGFYGIQCNLAVQACSTQHYGSVRVNSAHSDEYYIYINGSLVGQQGYGTTTYNNISGGYTTIHEEQVNYTFFQNKYDQYGTVPDCGILNSTF